MTDRAGSVFMGKNGKHLLVAAACVAVAVGLGYRSERLSKGRALAIASIAVFLTTVALHFDRKWTEEELRRAPAARAPEAAPGAGWWEEPAYLDDAAPRAPYEDEELEEGFAPQVSGVLIDPPAETRARAPELPTTEQLFEGDAPMHTFAPRIDPIFTKRPASLTHRPNEILFDPQEVARQMGTSTVSPEAADMAMGAMANSTGGLADDLSRQADV